MAVRKTEKGLALKRWLGKVGRCPLWKALWTTTYVREKSEARHTADHQSVSSEKTPVTAGELCPSKKRALFLQEETWTTSRKPRRVKANRRKNKA